MNESPQYLAVLILLCLLSTGISILILYKVRRIHLSTYKLLDDTEATRRETLALFAQIQALNALERLLCMPKALPTMRGWAGSPDFLLRVAEEILSRKPTTIMECSSGVSTIVAARAAQINGKGHIYSLEHDPMYACKTRDLLAKYQLEDWATIIDAPLTKSSYGTPWYSLGALPKDTSSIDMLVVDGPPSTIGKLARYPAMPSLHHLFSQNILLIIDDTDRNDEQEMLARWKTEYPGLTEFDAYCEKGCALLERTNKG